MIQTREPDVLAKLSDIRVPSKENVGIRLRFPSGLWGLEPGIEYDLSIPSPL